MVEAIPKGLCQCGCGQKTRIAPFTRTKIGWVKGEPIRFINSHHFRLQKLHLSPQWRGGKACPNGYPAIKIKDHPRADIYGYVSMSILVAEKALGKPLPKGAVVHHANRNTKDFSATNLVVCQDVGYHNFIHQRMRAFEQCGNPNFRKCCYCKTYDDPLNIVIPVNKRGGTYHRECRSIYESNKRRCRKKQGLVTNF